MRCPVRNAGSPRHRCQRLIQLEVWLEQTEALHCQPAKPLPAIRRARPYRDSITGRNPLLVHITWSRLVIVIRFLRKTLEIR